MELTITKMKIGQQSNEELGAIVKRLIDLGGMNPPGDPKSTIEYVRHTWKNYEVQLLEDSVEWFLQGNYDPKTRQLTAVLIIKLIREFLKSTPNKSRYFQKQKQAYQMPERDEEKVSRKALHAVADDYKKSFEDTKWLFKFNIKSLSSLASWVEKKGWIDKEYLDDKYAELEWKLSQYCERQYKHHLSNKKSNDPLKALGYSYTEPSNEDLQNAIKVASIIEKAIEDGKI